MYASAIIPIAQLDTRLESFSAGFQKNRAQIDSGDVVLLLTCFVVVFAVLWLVARWSERRVRNDSSLGLFWTLAKTHDIGWSDRWLLWRLARARRVAEPALLFLDPRLTSPQSSHHLAPHATARLKTLRRKLFSGIDRVEDAASEPSESETNKHGTNAPAPLDRDTPSSQDTHKATAQGLEEALGALRALNLQDQPIRREETPAEPSAEEEEQSPTAEFPSKDTPVIDLYPWLGSDWEIKNSDE